MEVPLIENIENKNKKNNNNISVSGVNKEDECNKNDDNKNIKSNSEIFNEKQEINDKLKYLYEFQCINIKSSYLPTGFFNLNEKYLKLQRDLSDIKIDMEKMKKYNLKLSNQIDFLIKEFNTLKKIIQIKLILLMNNHLIQNMKKRKKLLI